MTKSSCSSLLHSFQWGKTWSFWNQLFQDVEEHLAIVCPRVEHKYSQQREFCMYRQSHCLLTCTSYGFTLAGYSI